MSVDLLELIRHLDAPSADEAEVAKYRLLGRRPDAVLPALAASVDGLDRDGKLLAVEIFEASRDRQAGPTLIHLLADPDRVVREWAVRAVTRLDLVDAAPALVALHGRLLRERLAPDHCEAVGVRRALTRFGVRSVVMPPRTAALLTPRSCGPTWPVTRVVEVLDDLADHDQVVLYFLLWRVDADGTLLCVDHEGVDWHFDPALSWNGNVESARAAALREALAVPQSDDRVVTINWIDESDLRPLG